MSDHTIVVIWVIKTFFVPFVGFGNLFVELVALGKGRGTRNQIANIHWIIEKQENSRKTSTSALLTMLKPLIVHHNKLWKILIEMGIPDHHTSLLRNLYAGQETVVGTGYEATDCFQIGKGV